MEPYQALISVSDRLEIHGVPPVSEWWRGHYARFYASTAQTMVGMVGRGGDKSRTSVIASIAEVTEGEFKISPGERHYFAHISVSLDEARKTMKVLEEYLTLLQIRFKRVGETIDLEGQPRGWKLLACSIRAVSGFRCIGYTADENAKWEIEGVNPDAEVLASIRAMCITHPGARGRMISSPLGTMGYFYDRFSARDKYTYQCQAPTWVANPSVTEEQTHAAEPHFNTWRREYAAIPQAGIVGAFQPEELADMGRIVPANAEPLWMGALFIDSSSGRGDGWAYGLGAYVHLPGDENFYKTKKIVNQVGQHLLDAIEYDERGNPIPNPNYSTGKRVLISSIGAIEGEFATTKPFSEVVTHCADLAKRFGISKAYGDQYLSYALDSEFTKNRMHFESLNWSAESKVEALATLRRMLRERTFIVDPESDAEETKNELLKLEEKILPSGVLTVVAKRTGVGHADRAMLALLMARAESEGHIRGSPIEKNVRMEGHAPY